MIGICINNASCSILTDDTSDDDVEESSDYDDNNDNGSNDNNNSEPQTKYYRCYVEDSCYEYEDLKDYQIDEPFQFCSSFNDMPQFSGVIWEETACPSSSLIGYCKRAKYGVTEKIYYYSTGDWSFIDDFTTWCSDLLKGTWTGG